MRHILRSGYVQHRARKVVHVTRRDGTKYSFIRKAGMSYVRPVPIKDVGAVGKGPKVIGNLKGGMLTMYGYHPVEAMTNRHKALVKAIRVGREDPHAVMKRLVAISTLTKRTLPRASRIYKQDAMWIRSKYANSFGTK